ncbi:MAG: hypothetical protein QNL51_16995 [Opitutaceae bacterium]|tara:strand:+ start:246 stop:536 length:291 start_codon:yes stop_codon:yes gene_type:complete
MPPSFAFPAAHIKLWVPFAFTPEQQTIDERGNEYSDMVALLKPGTTPEMLSADCAAIIEQNLQVYPKFRPWVESSGFTGIAQSFLEMETKEVRSML